MSLRFKNGLIIMRRKPLYLYQGSCFHCYTKVYALESFRDVGLDFLRNTINIAGISYWDNGYNFAQYQKYKGGDTLQVKIFGADAYAIVEGDDCQCKFVDTDDKFLIPITGFVEVNLIISIFIIL